MFNLKSKRSIVFFAASLTILLSWQLFFNRLADTEILPEPIPQGTTYRWQNVAVGGYGYVTGMVIHPREGDLIYIRTDVGGAYRWEPEEKTWIPLMEMFGFGDRHLFGIASLALDPNNPDIVYVATGEYTDERGTLASILKSTNRGQSWQRTNLPFKLGSNDEWRWNGEKLAVDPDQSNILYLGTRNNGLWKSIDGAKSWQEVMNFPVKGTANRGISFVTFDSSKSKTIYVGVAGTGVYRSQDGGNSWENLNSGEAINPNRAAVAKDGTLYVTFDNPGAIKKFQQQRWIDITPREQIDYNAIAVAPNNPQAVIAAEFKFESFNQIFKTKNGGSTWQRVKYHRRSTVPWWSRYYWGVGIASIAIAPDNPDRVWYTDSGGLWRTDNINAIVSVWRNYMNGLEETMNFTLKSQPKSGVLLNGSGDIGGLRHDNLKRYPSSFMRPARDDSISDIVSIDASVTHPNFVVAVGGRRWTKDPDKGYGAYSLNDGKNWREFSSYPRGFRKSKNGRVAVSATSDRQIVWIPQRDIPYYSKDRGKTWNQSRGAPSKTTFSVWNFNQPLASDRVNGNKFYLYKEGKFYRSNDSGANWSVTVSNLPKLDMDWDNVAWSNIKAAPGLEGEVWASFNTSGLYRSSNSGDSFTKIEKVQQAYLFAFGKNAPGKTNPTVFVYGKVNDIDGIFRSDDFGQNWVKIDVPGQPIGKDPKYLEGDKKVYGRVFIGSGGRGIYYGELVDK